MSLRAAVSLIALAVALTLAPQASAASLRESAQQALQQQLTGSYLYDRVLRRADDPKKFLRCDLGKQCTYVSEFKDATPFDLPPYDGSSQGKIYVSGSNGKHVLDREHCHEDKSELKVSDDTDHCGAKHWQFDPDTGKLGEDGFDNCISRASAGKMVHCSDTYHAAMFVPMLEDPGYMSGYWVPVGTGMATSEAFSYTRSDSSTTTDSWSDTNTQTAEVKFGKSVKMSDSNAYTLSHAYEQTLAHSETESCNVNFDAGPRWRWIFTWNTVNGEVGRTVAACTFTQTHSDTCCAAGMLTTNGNSCVEPAAELAC